MRNVFNSQQCRKCCLSRAAVYYLTPGVHEVSFADVFVLSTVLPAVCLLLCCCEVVVVVESSVLLSLCK